MNFADFQQFRNGVLNERPDVVDCAQTNLYAALARLIPEQTPSPEKTVHRCHLAKEWCDYFGISSPTHRALVSCGVRDSLSRLFNHFTGKDVTLWMPTDNYPVYGELARAAGITPREFPTLPMPVWPESSPTHRPELLLITNPLKPLGRWLSSQDVATLKSWLHASPHRRLILDAVYTFEHNFHRSTLELMETDQVILLHSLTKGWLNPRLFGIALVPEQDVGSFTSAFRQNSPSQSNLAHTRELMWRHAKLPEAVGREIAAARRRLFPLLPASIIQLGEEMESSYLFPIAGNYLDILKSTNLLGISASVFGSERDDITILSSLGFC